MMKKIVFVKFLPLLHGKFELSILLSFFLKVYLWFSNKGAKEAIDSTTFCHCK